MRRAVGHGHAVAGVEQMADQNDQDIRARGDGDLESVDDLVVALGDIGVVEHPAAGEGGLARFLVLEQVGVQVEESGELFDGEVVGQVEGVHLVEHGAEDGVELRGGLANADEGAHAEHGSGKGVHLKVGVQAVADDVVGPLVEDGHALPVGLDAVGAPAEVRGVEVELGAGGDDVGEGPDRHGEDDGVRGGAAALERVEEIGVGLGVGGGEDARGGDDVEGQDVVSG